jgi:hypothetical protein
VARLCPSKQQGAVLHGFGVAVEGPPRSPQPAPGDGRMSTHAVVLVQPDRALARTASIPELVEELVGALSRLDAVVEAAEPPGRLGQHVQPVGLTLRRVEREVARLLEGRRPVVSRQRLADRGQPVGGHRARARGRPQA